MESQPFVRYAKLYANKNWNIFPLPEKKKAPPLGKEDDPQKKGFTGRRGRLVTEEDLDGWVDDPKWEFGNIAFRPGNVIHHNGVDVEVLGIDVDNYGEKHGGEHLKELEEAYGPLPNTYITSARNDGVSGIRWFLTPTGYEYMGKPYLKSTEGSSDSIEIIQRNHRYGVMPPSIHPEGMQYRWYGRGDAPDGKNVFAGIPDIQQLSVLPEKWFRFLSRNGIPALGVNDIAIDMDSSNSQVVKWANKHFPKGDMCLKVEKSLAKALVAVEEAADHHEPLLKAHWHLYRLAAEGHTGWSEAVQQVNDLWTARVLDEGVRSLGQAKHEIIRSRLGGLRKIKGAYDSFREEGAEYLVHDDPCASVQQAGVALSGNGPNLTVLQGGSSGSSGNGSGGSSGGSGTGGPPFIRTDTTVDGVDPADFDKNEKGQAEHFAARIGDNVKYISDFNGWVMFAQDGWVLDKTGMVVDLFINKCSLTSKVAAQQVRRDLEAATASGFFTATGTGADPTLASWLALAKKLEAIADSFGNYKKALETLKVFSTIPGNTVEYKELNWDPTVLAMPNGKVLRLVKPTNKPQPDVKAVTLEKNKKEYLTTLCTGANLLPPKDIDPEEVMLWKDYLDLFLPAEPALEESGEETVDFSYRRFVQKVLGSMLFGGNPEKVAVFLKGISDSGKSTMLKAVMASLGDYAKPFEPNNVFIGGKDTNPELGNLLHCRVIGTSEAGSQKIQANPLKRNTGGDLISVTRKYANAQVHGVPHFVPIVATNQSPTIDDADEATIKRILVLPFDYAVPDRENDRTMDSIIEEKCKRAVFSWLVSGYRLYIKEGLAWELWHPKALKATKEFSAELNDVSNFVNDYCWVASKAVKVELEMVPGSLAAAEKHEAWRQVTLQKLYQMFDSEFRGTKQHMGKRAFSKKVKELFGVKTEWKRAGGEEDTAVGNKSHETVFVGLRWKGEANRVKTSQD